MRTSHRLCAVVTGLEVETRARCRDDDHRPGCFNPCMNVTFCHCGRVRYAGSVPVEPWLDREARLVDHMNVVVA